MDALTIVNFLRAVIIALIVYALFVRYRKHASYVRQIEKLPGPKALPIIGNLIHIGAFSSARMYNHDQTVFLGNRRGLCQIYSAEPLFRLWFGPDLFVMIHKPDSVKVLLNNNANINKSVSYKLLDNLIEDSLFLRNGEPWKFQRRALTPAFHFRFIQDDFIPVVNTHGKRFVERLRTKCDKEWVDFSIELLMCTMDIFAEASLGIDLSSKSEMKRKYVGSLNSVLGIASLRAQLPWLSRNFIFEKLSASKKNEENVRYLRKLSVQMIEERKEILSKKTVNNEDAKLEKDNNENIYFLGRKKRLGFLDVVLQLVQEGKYSEKVMIDEVTNALIAGHGTTKFSLLMSLYLIGLHADVQEKIFEELQSIYGDDKEEPVTYEDLPKLIYTDRVIKESLRLFPSVPTLGRELSEDTVIGGLTIPKGTTCFLLVNEIHRDPVEFPNPEVFDPDRFLPENCAKRHPYAYIPFSAGSRNCIGQRFALVEEKIIIATLLRNFKLKSLDPLDKIHPLPELIQRVDNPIRMKITERI